MDYELKSSKSPLLFFIFLILIMVIAVLALRYRQNSTKTVEKEETKVEEISRIINYNYNNYYYIVTQSNEEFSVTIKAKVDCEDETNCNPTIVDEYDITSDTDKSNLKDLFNDLFADENKGEKSITRTDINIDQETFLESILREPETEESVKIISTSYDSESNIKRKGYTIEEKDGKILLTIGIGEKPNGGYGVQVTRQVTGEDFITLTVKELTPDPNYMYTEALTYPAVILELNKMPKNITIIEENNNYHYSEYKEEVKDTNTSNQAE